MNQESTPSVSVQHEGEEVPSLRLVREPEALLHAEARLAKSVTDLIAAVGIKRAAGLIESITREYHAARRGAAHHRERR